MARLTHFWASILWVLLLAIPVVTRAQAGADEPNLAPVITPAEVNKSGKHLFEDIQPGDQVRTAKRDRIERFGLAPDDKAPVITPEQFLNPKKGGCENGCCDEIPCCNVCEEAPKWGIFADFLYLHPRNADVAYALPQIGIGLGSAPAGPVVTLDPQYEPGIRAGIYGYLNDHTRIGAAYTRFESRAVSAIDVTGTPNTINPLLIFPGSVNLGFLGQQANAQYDIDFQLVDVQLERTVKNCDQCWWGYLVGARYGVLDQQLRAVYNFAPIIGTKTVDTTVNFDGAGPRIGLQGEHRISPCGKWTVFGRGIANFLVGESRSTYRQTNQLGAVEVASAFSEDMIVSLLELEVGVAWHSSSGRLRIWGGYMVNAWLNTTTTPEWINAVQSSTYHGLGDTITFDGLMTGFELRF